MIVLNMLFQLPYIAILMMINGLILFVANKTDLHRYVISLLRWYHYMLYFNFFLNRPPTIPIDIRHIDKTLWATLVMSLIFFLRAIYDFRLESRQKPTNEVEHMWQTWLNVIRDIQQTHAWKKYRWFDERFQDYIW